MPQGLAYTGTTTRSHMGGATSSIDQHLELYTGFVDSQFQYSQIFAGLSAQRTTEDRTNNIRIDRLNTSSVKGRKAGEQIDSQRITSDKLNIVVECMMYIRNPIDDMDDWTSPDFLTDIARNNGTQFGLAYDEAHIIRLQKARTWVAPAHLKPAFSDGMEVPVTLMAAPATTADFQANAVALHTAHSKAVNALIKKRVPLTDIVTIVTPDVYSALLYHNQLINKDFTSTGGDFANRRVVVINGITVVESVAFPTSVYTNHILSTTTNSNAFNATAADIKCEMILFSRNLSLVTVTAKGWHSKFWTDNAEMCNVLDCRAMFTVDVRRPDTVVAVSVTRA